MVKVAMKAKDSYLLGDPVEIIFTYKNTSDQIIYLAKWFTPFDDHNSRYLNLIAGGKAIKYNGLLAKPLLLTLDNTIKLNPGEEKYVTINLTDTFYISEIGKYELTYGIKNIFKISNVANGKLAGEAGLTHIKQNEEKVVFTVTAGGVPKKTIGMLKSMERSLENKDNTPDATTDYPKPLMLDMSEEQRTQTVRAYYIMIHYLQKLVSRMSKLKAYDDSSEKKGDDGDGHFSMVFGAVHNMPPFDEGQEIKLPDPLDKIYKDINDINNTLKKDKVIFEYDATEIDKYAYINKNDADAGLLYIYLCPLFFNKAPETGENSRAGTIFHELSHLICDTDDYVYERKNLRNLAKNYHQIAIDNADSYLFFLEAAYLCWSKPVELDYKSSHNPSLIEYDNKLYAIYKGVDDNKELYYATYENDKWSKGKRLVVNNAEPKSKYPPSVNIFGREKVCLILIYRGQERTKLYSTCLKNSIWDNEFILKVNGNDVESNYCPTATSFFNDNKDNSFFVFQGTSSKNIFYCYQDKGFAETYGNKRIKVNGVNPDSEYEPAVFNYKDIMYVVYKPPRETTLKMISLPVKDRGTDVWSAESDLPGKITCKYCPRLTTIDNYVYMSHRSGTETDIYQSQFYYDEFLKEFIWTDNLKVQDNSLDPSIAIQTDPEHSVATFQGRIFMVYRDPKTSTLYYSWQWR